MTATIIIGVVQLMSNAVSTTLVDRAGRRPLLLVSAAVMCASMAAMGSAFYFEFERQSWLGQVQLINACYSADYTVNSTIAKADSWVLAQFWFSDYTEPI